MNPFSNYKNKITRLHLKLRKLNKSLLNKVRMICIRHLSIKYLINKIVLGKR